MSKSDFKSQAIAEAIAVEQSNQCCHIALLSGLFKSIGTIEITKKGVTALFTSERAQLSCLIVKTIKALYKTDVDIERAKYSAGVKKNQEYFEIRVPTGQTKQLLSESGIMDIEGDNYTAFAEGIPQKVVEYSCCAKTFVRAMFIGCGSVYVSDTKDKKSGGYHFEFQVGDKATAHDLQLLLSKLDIEAKTSVWGANHLVYLKDKILILSLLQQLSLLESALKLNEIIRERKLSSSINRNSICEAANLDKSYTASANHLLAIQEIDKKFGLSSLPTHLQQTAYARINNPRYSLSELALALKISKSCLSHRMRKLMQYASSSDIEI